MMRGTCLLLVLPTLAAAEIFRAFSATKVDAYNGKNISQSKLWTLNNLTKLECMSECVKDKYCVSFHFSLSVCVALRERFEGSSVASTDALGYQLFQTNKPLAKVGSYCELDGDCASLPNSHCNENVCRCDVGYGPGGDACRILTVSASVKVGSYCELDGDCASLPNSHCYRKACRCDVGYGIYMYGDVCRILTECVTFSNNFTVYKSSYIHGYDTVQQISTYESCLAFCSSNTYCPSADFLRDLEICYQNKVTWLQAAPSARITNRTTADFFQRECLW